MTDLPKLAPVLLTVLLLTLAPAFAPGSLGADEREQPSRDYISDAPANPTKAWTLSSGGRLYDNWMAALGVEGPDTTHPAWPLSSTGKSGNVTWRCKSCHGWDYLGAAGAYRAGSYFTGIPGVRGAAGNDPAEIVKVRHGKGRDECQGEKRRGAAETRVAASVRVPPARPERFGVRDLACALAPR